MKNYASQLNKTNHLLIKISNKTLCLGLLFFVTCFALPAQAEIFKLGNCGSTYAQRLGLRDSYGGASFAEACRTHDKCYETCGKNKRDCDSQFGGTMRKACSKAYNSPWHVVQRKLCREIANTYESAVHRMGGDAYRAAQKTCS